MPFDTGKPEMTAEEFRLLRDFVYAYCGILVREDMKYVMERRLWPRLEALGLTNFGAYYQYLRLDARRRPELETAVEALTTHETYFFREPRQLQSFTDEVLPVLERRNARARRLRLWSAGCSSGEEAYTLAMLLLETGRFTGWNLEVCGTDISRRVLATARQGEYGPNALRATSPDMLARYFVSIGPNRVRVRDEVRAMVTFGHHNLRDTEASPLNTRVDAVFCRNVLIYFDAPARQRVLRLLYDKLVPGGYLMLGHSENLINLSADFELVHLRGDLVYRRPELGGTGAP